MKIIKSINTATLTFLLILGLANPGYAALVDMAEYQDWEGIQAAISTEDINAVQADGMSALYWAVYHDQADIVRLLLDSGADTSLANRYGMTPLLQAAINANSEVISLLLDAGANPNAATLQGETALMNIAKAGNLQGVQALLDAGAEIDTRDYYAYQTPLMWAVASNSADVVSLLIENGADVNAISAEFVFSGMQQGGTQGDFPNGGLTPLHHAARENAIESAQVLLAAGADPDILDAQGISVLRFAATNENLDIAKLLIEAGAYINDGAFVDILEIPYKKFIQQHAASNYENQTTVEELTALMIEMGVDVDATPVVGIPMYSTAFISESGTAGRTALFNAVFGDRIDVVAFLLENGANPNTVTTGGTPGDTRRIEVGGNSILSAALEVFQGIPVVSITANDAANQPSLEEKQAMLDLLFEYGVDVNGRVAHGGTVLHQAAALGKDEVIQYLLERGIDLSVKDDSNRTALDVASGVAEYSEENSEQQNSVETPIYESSMAILTEAMDAQNISIDEYVEPGEA